MNNTNGRPIEICQPSKTYSKRGAGLKLFSDFDCRVRIPVIKHRFFSLRKYVRHDTRAVFHCKAHLIQKIASIENFRF